MSLDFWDPDKCRKATGKYLQRPKQRQGVSADRTDSTMFTTPTQQPLKSCASGMRPRRSLSSTRLALLELWLSINMPRTAS
eukprot:2389061-Pleurochrysis_carterae.AAC.2